MEIVPALLLAYRFDGNAAARRHARSRCNAVVVLAAVAKDNDSIAFSPRNEIPAHAATVVQLVQLVQLVQPTPHHGYKQP